jgi:RNA polymerase sigma-32 factor
VAIPGKKRKKKTKKTSSIPTPSEQKRVVAEVVDETSQSFESSTTLPALTDGLSFYLEAIQKYPLLSKEEEAKIAQRYHEHRDPKDAEILVTSNLRFVVKVAAEYSQFGSKLIDLIQEGNVGLMHAVTEFNPYKGARLITYAVWWIRGYIQDFLMKQHSMVKIGTTHNQRKLFYNLEKEKARLDQMGMEPTVKLLSDRLGVPEKDVKIMEKRLSGKDLSLDQPLGDDGQSTRLDLESDGSEDITDVLIEKESLAHLQQALEKIKPELSEKEQHLLETRLLSDEPVTLQQIGDEWGVTREAVRQMEARLLKKIKQEVLAELD